MITAGMNPEASETSETSRLEVEKMPPNLKTEGVSMLKDE